MKDYLSLIVMVLKGLFTLVLFGIWAYMAKTGLADPKDLELALKGAIVAFIGHTVYTAASSSTADKTASASKASIDAVMQALTLAFVNAPPATTTVVNNAAPVAVGPVTPPDPASTVKISVAAPPRACCAVRRIDTGPSAGSRAMKRAAIVLLALALASCATYSIKPFYDPGAQKVICCEASVTNSKNIATVNFFATESNGTYIVHFVETGVSASAPIAAAAIAASDVSAAVTATAITVGKFVK